MEITPDSVITRREFEAVIIGLKDSITQGFAHSESTAILRDKASSEAAILREISSREAIKVALEAINKRFDNTNEWRDVVDGDRKDLARKETVEKQEAALTELRLAAVSKDSFKELLNAVNELRLNAVSRESVKELKDIVGELQISRASLAGKATMSDVTRVTIFSALGILLAAIGILIKFIK